MLAASDCDLTATSKSKLGPRKSRRGLLTAPLGQGSTPDHARPLSECPSAEAPCHAGRGALQWHNAAEGSSPRCGIEQTTPSSDQADQRAEQTESRAEGMALSRP